MMRLRGVWTVNLADAADRLRDVQLVHPHPAVRRAADGTGYRLRRERDAGRALPAADTVLMLVSGPIAGRMAGRVGSRVPLSLGAGFAASRSSLLAVAHSERWEVYLAAAILGVGIGLAFASMANLIVEAVRPTRRASRPG